MVKSMLLSLCVGGVLPLLSTSACADKLFSQFGPVEAFLADDFTCAPKVRLKLVSQSENVFSGDKSALDKLVGGVRAALGFQCDGIKDVLVSGVVGGKTVFAAVTSESSGWTLIDVPIEMIASQAPANESTTAAKPKSTENAGVTALALPPKQETPENKNSSQSVLPPIVSAPKSPAATEAAPGIEQFRDVKKNVETGSFPTEGYKFGGLMTALYLGRPNDIPDDRKTRANVISILRVFAENCGEPPSDVALMAIKYGSERMRQYERDPLQGIAGMLQGLAQMRDRGFETGDYTGAMADWAKSEAIFTSEGVQDGRAFISRYGCQGREYDEFANNLYDVVLARAYAEPAAYDEVTYLQTMSASFRASLGLKDPEQILRDRRLTAFAAAAEKACSTQFPNGKFCSCTIDALKKEDVADNLWSDVGADFVSISRYPQMRSVVKACY